MLIKNKAKKILVGEADTFDLPSHVCPPIIC
jgi:hypothetical protein